MKEIQIPCNPTAIQRFVADRLPPSEVTELEIHLETCFSCREQLDFATAPPDQWFQTRDALSSAEITNSSSSGNLKDSGNTETKETSLLPKNPTTNALLRLLGPTDDPQMLGRFGPYEIAGLIGNGGMGVVFKGFDRSLNRFVAIKTLLPHFASNPSARLRFAREAQAAAAITHENVIAIHGVSEWQDMPYLVMPFIKGESLQTRIDRQGPLELASLLRLGVQIAAGLAAAHAQGLIHRDIKPANILLEQGVERLKITDFGLARAADDASITRTGLIAGTPMYMSPEQARGEPLDARSDLFSLGSLLYVAATGKAPFRAETSYGILRRITDSEPTPIRELTPQLPRWFSDLVERLHRKTPSHRFASAHDVAHVFEQCLSHLQQPETNRLPEFCHHSSTPRRSLLQRFPAGALVPVLIVLSLPFWFFLDRNGEFENRPDVIRSTGTPRSHDSANPGDGNGVISQPNSDTPSLPEQRDETPAWDYAPRRVQELKQRVNSLRQRVQSNASIPSEPSR